MRNFFGFTAAAALALGLGSIGAQAQAPFYTCQIVANAAGVTNSTANGVCQLDPNRMTNWAGTGFLLNFSSGASATVSVEETGDTPVNISSGGLWNADTAFASKTANTSGLFTYPVTGVRLNVTPYVSGTITLTIIQPALHK